MTTPAIIRISKATLVPTKHNIVNQYRTDWRFVHKIDYNDSEYMFKMVGDENYGLQIETDAQFAKWMVDNFGHGRFHLHMFKKGISGWTFYNFDCTQPNKFMQLKKDRTPEELEKEKLLKDLRGKRGELSAAQDKESYQNIKKEIEELAESLEMEQEFEDELREIDKKIKPRKIKVFKNMQPLYKEHAYEDYLKSDLNERIIDGQRMW